MSKEHASAQRNQTGHASRAEDSENLTPEFFDSVLHQSFSVNLQSALLNPITREILQASPLAEWWQSDRPVELVLVEVTRYPKLRAIEGGFDHRPREPFSLLFRGSHDQPLISATYDVTHDKLGTLQLFLNPVQVSVKSSVESNPEGRFYESTFS